MAEKAKEPKNDRALRFYSDVLGLERLHYGIWNAEDELTLENLKAAQERYENYLIENIPEGANRILDVGCGTGVLCQELLKRGYKVDGLSPDKNQREHFEKNIQTTFHFCRFEDFVPQTEYDCIIMSESCQYIPLERVFDVAGKALRSGGHLMICDYFVKDGATGVLAKSGHNYTLFKQTAETSGLAIVKHRDITKETAKTLEIAKLWAEKILLGADILSEKVRYKHARTWKFLCWLFRKKINRINQDRDLIDAKKFIEAKTYEFFLFRKENPS